MKKISFILGCVVIASLGYETASAASASLGGQTFALKGSFGGSVAVSCRAGGSHAQKFKARKNLVANIAFHEDGTFDWYGDALHIGGTGKGEWTQSGNKTELDFDDPNSMSYLRVFGNQQLSSYSNDASFGATISPAKYGFSAKIVGKTLTVTETSGFKADAQASYAGSSNSCGYRINLSRVYRGKAQ